MSRHSFDPEIASQVGLNAAVIYQNIYWWCEKNAANERNIHDGRAWTYNSIKAFEELFPYLTANQIRTALTKLEDVGLVLTGNFNKEARDRTKWYAVPQMHLGKNPDPIGKEPAPLPDGKPDSKQTPISPKGASLSILCEVLPEETAQAFIEHRGTGKGKLTVAAAKLLVSKLMKLAPDEQGRVACIEQSIMSGWSGVFPVRVEPQGAAGFSAGDTSSSDGLLARIRSKTAAVK